MEEEIKPKKVNAKPAKKGNVPVADINFGAVAKTVSENWTKNSWLTLLWLTPTEFATNAASFADTLTKRNQTGLARPQITQSLKLLDQKIDGGLSYVKGYITDKHKKEAAKSYYASFGMVHKNDKYSIPKDQNSRLEALGLMIGALTANGFSDKEFGTAFWKSIQDEYKTLLGSANDTDSTVSSKVGDKNMLKKDLKKGLNAIVKAIQANYPDTYKTELRNWGFQKEKY
jgi:hypothetical protein